MRTEYVLAVALLLCGCAATGPTPPTVPSEKAAKINVQLGLAYMREGRNDVALEKLQKALQMDPDYPETHGTLALLYQRLGEDALADQHFAKAVELGPDNPGILNNYGQFLCSRGQAPAGKRMFERALANPLYNTPEVAHTNYGLCAKRLGDLEDAEAHFRKALQLRPTLSTALLEMADLSLTEDRDLAARGYLQRFEEVGTHTPRSLWLGIRIECKLGGRDALASYDLALRRQFPDSEEARLLEENGADCSQ